MLGTGLVCLRAVRFEGPVWLRLPVALFAGVALACTFAVVVLVGGAGVLTLRILSCLLLAIGVWGCVVELRFGDTRDWRQHLVKERWLSAIVLVSLLLNLIVALAPSTKIDEIRYHMPIPQRIEADDGLRAYREPWEAAIYPQTEYEIGLSLVRVWGWTDVPNVMGWGIGAVLILLVAGATARLASSAAVGLLAAALAEVGLHPALHHVTGGSHSLGDLAMVVAFVLLLLSRKPRFSACALAWLAIVAAAFAVAASTKLTIMPICVALTVYSGFRAVRSNSTGRIEAVIIPCGAWLLCYAPLVCWSVFHTGSPFGTATASFFHSTFFGPETLAKVAAGRAAYSRTLAHLRHAAYVTLLSYSPAVILAICLVAAGIRRHPEFRFLSLAVIFQAMIVAIVAPPDLRFMGGLQVVALIGAAAVLAVSPRGRRWLEHPLMIAIVLAVPWLAIQARYTAIFIPVTFGIESKEAFLRQHVPLAADFAALDRLLPPDAVL
jgi:hypothetical protein